MQVTGSTGEREGGADVLAKRTAHVLIRGRVQGVGFRAWVHHQAELRGLEGWVRNRQDGAVEAFFRGKDHVVEAMLDVCREGPSNAFIDRIELLEEAGEALAGPEGFAVLPTV
jgi:acylphosphatase